MRHWDSKNIRAKRKRRWREKEKPIFSFLLCDFRENYLKIAEDYMVA